MSVQCGMVSPFWVELGWVRWHGTPSPEKLFTIEYRRCRTRSAGPVAEDGITFHRCLAHTKSVEGGSK